MASILSIADLRRAGRGLAPPFQLALGTVALPQALDIQAIHRLLPGKRLTARARWCGRTVLVKLFFDRYRYRRHWEREGQGLAALARAGIATPRVLAQAENRSGRGAVLIAEYLPDAEPLDRFAEDQATMAAALEVIAAMHRAGLEQTDIHPGNFLRSQGRIYAIDGDGIVRSAAPLPIARAVANLGLFLAQFEPEHAEALLTLATSADTRPQLAETIVRQREIRWQRYRSKLLRDCTEIRCEKTWHRLLAVRREHDHDDLRALLDDPDSYLDEAELLKDGNSSTVGLVRLPSRTVVVKRYNIKHWRHGLSRCWRPSRAWHSWLNAHRLRFLGIATPEPFAFLERRRGPLRGTAYFVMEHVEGETLAAKRKLEKKADSKTLAPVARLLTALFRGRLVHGDLKASNILMAAQGPCLLDLDAMAHRPDASDFRLGFRRDRERFLANWPPHGVIRRWFDKHLPKPEDV